MRVVCMVPLYAAALAIHPLIVPALRMTHTKYGVVFMYTAGVVSRSMIEVDRKRKAGGKGKEEEKEKRASWVSGVGCRITGGTNRYTRTLLY